MKTYIDGKPIKTKDGFIEKPHPYGEWADRIPNEIPLIEIVLSNKTYYCKEFLDKVQPNSFIKIFDVVDNEYVTLNTNYILSFSECKLASGIFVPNPAKLKKAGVSRAGDYSSFVCAKILKKDVCPKLQYDEPFDRYFYDVETDKHGRKMIVMQGEIYENPVDRTEECCCNRSYLTSLQFSLEELQRELKEDTLFETFNDNVDTDNRGYTFSEAYELCQTYFDSMHTHASINGGRRLSLFKVSEYTPDGHYYCDIEDIKPFLNE